jgi:hypothetical protein
MTKVTFRVIKTKLTYLYKVNDEIKNFREFIEDYCRSQNIFPLVEWDVNSSNGSLAVILMSGSESMLVQDIKSKTETEAQKELSKIFLDIIEWHRNIPTWEISVEVEA